MNTGKLKSLYRLMPTLPDSCSSARLLRDPTTARAPKSGQGGLTRTGRRTRIRWRVNLNCFLRNTTIPARLRMSWTPGTGRVLAWWGYGTEMVP